MLDCLLVDYPDEVVDLPSDCVDVPRSRNYLVDRPSYVRDRRYGVRWPLR